MERFTRRRFVQITGLATGLFVSGLGFARSAYSEAKAAAEKVQSYLTDRLGSIYKHDKEMKFRKSQDNPSVKQLYTEFLDHPNSHMAHRLLHTHYTDRSARVKILKERGVKLALYPEN
ncbi:iron hydrogenase small subunit [Desulfomonile tiedjei]|uniref:Iron only hydrogenase large subunit n=1 Tax=Desulfomonile tiedjei (strain ATCC 49306 / DSM 6799 / DCB-1) TaxID=706587 RepID=I4CDX2_DESTA|nr:iron hydrogenase small subunit [Desulfomonile tiedjei]AFM27763.1 iron only hydrogenase large subunit [Desulfomonile tiedjei DSM 6799]